MNFPLKIYVILVHLRLLVDHNHVMNDHDLHFFDFVQDDKKHTVELMMMHHFYHVLIYLKKNFFHILNTKISKELIEKKNYFKNLH
jgi:hypothetical protein